MTLRALLVGSLALSCACVVNARSAPPRAVGGGPAGPGWDSSGWTPLGEKWVQGRNDRDIIGVGARDGRFTALTFVVAESDLEMYDVVITFGNGQRWSPPTRHYFREGTRTRKIDLPGNARIIRRIDFRYGNMPGGGRAKVEVWGRAGRVAQPPPPPPPPPVVRPTPPRWNSSGWVLLGEKWVQGRNDRDVIRIGARDGRFAALTVVVSNSDLEMHDIVMTLGGGQSFSPPTRHYFREGTRTRRIDLPGGARLIRQVEFRYGNMPGGGRAKVQLWGKPGRIGGQAPPPPPPPPPVEPTPPRWNSAGWTRLGQKWVDGRAGIETLVASNGTGRFTALTLVVHEADVELRGFVVTFGNGDRWSPPNRHVFRDGARTRRINLPGEARFIRNVQFRYPNRQRAKVELWGKPGAVATRPPPPPVRPTPPRWNSSGWTMLGDKWVQGRRDRDVIRVGARDGRFTAITVVVSASDLQMRDIVVTFGNGQKFSPRVKHFFREGSRTRRIDLPGEARIIRSVEFRYGNLPGTGRAKVQLWAKPAKLVPRPLPQPPPPKTVPKRWDSRGWTALGEKWVQGRNDRDVIRVGRARGNFKTLTIVVRESDLQMFNVVVTFGNGQKYAPPIRHLFKEGSRTRRIDLPGQRRYIKNITFRYGNLPGTGRAKVQVWAK